MPKSPNKTDRKAKIFAKALIENDWNQSKAAKEITESKSTSYLGKLGTLMVNNSKVQREIEAILINSGVTEQEAVKVLKENLQAKIITDYKGKASMTDLPNYQERRKTAKTILELFDSFPARKIESKTLTLKVDYNKLTEDELLKKLQEQDEEINQLRNKTP